MDIGSKIKQLRYKAGLTQEQLATKLGISPQSVSKWETAVTMPDITLLPTLAGELGVTIDELFDLTVNQRLHRIENRLDLEEELPSDVFKEYEDFLADQMSQKEGGARALSLLAHLYHHRMEADSKRISKLAREAISRNPEKKGCQWLLQKAEGAMPWDWNVANHAAIIDFYKSVIKNDTVTPKSPLPYYYLIDNLIADHRTAEARAYLDECRRLPAHKPFLMVVYEAHIALAEYDAPEADAIMQAGLADFAHDSGFLFETAQYYARKCDYSKAIEFYEASFAAEEDQKPRFTDALQGIAIIYGILGDRQKAADTYDRMIACIKDEWGYSDGDAAVMEVQREKARLISQ